MLDSILKTYSVGDNLFEMLLKFVFIYDDKSCAISSDIFRKHLNRFTVENIEDPKFDTKFPWDDLYYSAYQFRCNINDYEKTISHHIVFPYNRNAVYNLIRFIWKHKTLKARIQQVNVYVANDELFINNEKFADYVKELSNNLVTDLKGKNPLFDLNDLEVILQFFRQLYVCYNLLRINNRVVESFGDSIMNPEKAGESFNSVMAEVESLKVKNSLVLDFDELCIDENTLDNNIRLIEYPIYPISIFQKQKLFQGKRIYMFVGPSGIGKSMLLSNIAGEYLVDYKKKHFEETELIFYFTFENLVEETAARIFSNAYFRLGCQNTIDDVLKQNVGEVDREVLRNRIQEIGRKLVVVYLNPGLYGSNTLRGIIQHKCEVLNGRPFVVLVDFVDKMRSDTRQTANYAEHLELGQIIDQLKAMAADLDCPVITVSHLNSEGCKIAKEDIRRLNSSNVGKSLRKYENSDVVAFMDVEDSGLDQFSIMTFYFSKHRYCQVDRSPVIQRKYMPQYAYIGALTKDDKELMDSAESSSDFDVDMW